MVMQCEFCRSDLADGALICANCRKATVAGRSAGGRRARKWIMWIVGPPLAFFVFLVVLGAIIGPQETPAERITRSCEEQFGVDTYESRNCQIALMAKVLIDAEDQKMQDAARGARVR